MRDTKKYDKSRQLHREGYLQENRVELKGNVEVLSISSMSEEGRNGGNEYAYDLLEGSFHLFDNSHNKNDLIVVYKKWQRMIFN